MSKSMSDIILAEFQRSGMSMLELSKRSGVRYSGVHRFVTGGGGVTLDVADKLVRALDLELVPRRAPKRKGK